MGANISPVSTEITHKKLKKSRAIVEKVNKSIFYIMILAKVKKVLSLYKADYDNYSVVYSVGLDVNRFFTSPSWVMSKVRKSRYN